MTRDDNSRHRLTRRGFLKATAVVTAEVLTQSTLAGTIINTSAE